MNFILTLLLSVQIGLADTGDSGVQDTGDTGIEDTGDTSTETGEPSETGATDTSDTETGTTSTDSSTAEDSGDGIISAATLAGEKGGFGCAAVSAGGVFTLWLSAMFTGLRREDF